MRKILSIYLFLIAAIIGIEISLCFIVAPTIFNPANSLGTGILSHFQSGQLMSAIFVKYNKFLIGISIICLLFEMINFNNNRQSPINLRLSTLILALVNFSLAIVFVLFFTDFILEAQKNGVEATQTAKFMTIHKASEWCMGLIMLAQLALLILKFPKKGE